MPVSIVIPTLDEACHLGATLEAVGRIRGEVEVIVADGGSRDETVQIARCRGARVVESVRGRGAQLHAGAIAARGSVLWFLHADTLPPADGAEKILRALRHPCVVGGNFAIVFDGPSRWAGFLTRLYPRLRWLGLRYGDSGIFVRREAYDHAGGFRPYPIFEDLDLIRRLRKLGRFVRLPSTVVTSSRRFEGRNFAPVFACWSSLQLLYWLGVSPHVLGKYYSSMRRGDRRSTRSPGA
ncbi:TIGR04283 family arsenosugar biosynthesis glycosyltransferase [Tautonia sociabilis]|nr:TIGR04283 family arsenosugar biosynthesis glycosyltransferase [Tautonia sociabilis]